MAWPLSLFVRVKPDSAPTGLQFLVGRLRQCTVFTRQLFFQLLGPFTVRRCLGLGGGSVQILGLLKCLLPGSKLLGVQTVFTTILRNLSLIHRLGLQ